MIGVHFWQFLAWSTLVLVPSGLRAENKADQSKPYGVISVLQSSEEGLQTLGNAGPAAKECIALITANEPCEVLIAVFNRDGRRLAHGWKPQWLKLKGWNEERAWEEVKEWKEQAIATLGSYPATADLKTQKAIEVWVLFFAPQRKEAGVPRNIEDLKTAVENASRSSAPDARKHEDKLLRQLENFLRDNAQSRRPKLEPLGKAGELRSFANPLDSPWRKSAVETNFSAQAPGLVIIPSKLREPIPTVPP